MKHPRLLLKALFFLCCVVWFGLQRPSERSSIKLQWAVLGRLGSIIAIRDDIPATRQIKKRWTVNAPNDMVLDAKSSSWRCSGRSSFCVSVSHQQQQKTKLYSIKNVLEVLEWVYEDGMDCKLYDTLVKGREFLVWADRNRSERSSWVKRRHC